MEQPPVSTSTLPEHNEVLLTRDMLLTILADLSSRILVVFRRPIRLVVHGGAAMLLHPGLYAQPGSLRRDTRDVDYIHRSFVEEWRQVGMPDAGERLQCCIAATAAKFRLGKDWMNSQADVALPVLPDHQGRMFDPIWTASLKPNNVHLHTVFTSPGLSLVSVTPFWAVALKLVRYEKHDAADITGILRNGTRLNGVQWSVEILERWLQTECWAMGYGNYPEQRRRQMRERIGHAVAQLRDGAPLAPPLPSEDLMRPHSRSLDVPQQQPQAHHRGLPRHKSMTFPPWTQPHPSFDSSNPSHHHPRSTPLPFLEPAVPPLPQRTLVRRSSMTFPVIPDDNVRKVHHSHSRAPTPAPALQVSSRMPTPLPMPVPQIPHSSTFSHSGNTDVLRPLSSSRAHTHLRSASHHFPSSSHPPSHMQMAPPSTRMLPPAPQPMVMPPSAAYHLQHQLHQHQPHSRGFEWASQVFITA